MTKKASQIGATLAEARDRADMSQAEIAELLGVDKQTVSRWERGERRPRADTYEKMMLVYSERIGVGTNAQRDADATIAILSAVSASLLEAWRRGDPKETAQRERAFTAAADSVFGGDGFLRSALREGLRRNLGPEQPDADTDQKSADGSV